MKPTMARCIHGHVWFRPCPQCDFMEAAWLASFPHPDARTLSDWMLTVDWFTTPPRACKIEP